MNLGQFVKATGSRSFRGATELFSFDLWKKQGTEGVFVLVRRFRITSNGPLEWAQHAPSEPVPVGFMVPLYYWDDRVDDTGVLNWTG